jgi:hypothetical protein
MHHVKTATVIRALGGTAAVAKALETTPRAVWNWCSTGKFPAHTYVAIQRQLADIGASAPDHLWAMRREKKAAS